MSRAQRVVLLAALYISQGIPFGFFIEGLPVIMRERGFFDRRSHFGCGTALLGKARVPLTISH